MQKSQQKDYQLFLRLLITHKKAFSCFLKGLRDDGFVVSQAYSSTEGYGFKAISHLFVRTCFTMSFTKPTTREASGRKEYLWCVA